MESNLDPDTPQPHVRVAQDSSSMAALVWVGTLFSFFLVPLIVYLVKKDDEFILDQTKEALNWGIVAAVCWLFGSITAVLFIGLLVLAVLGLVHLVFCILGAVNASKGTRYRLPFNVRLVK